MFCSVYIPEEKHYSVFVTSEKLDIEDKTINGFQALHDYLPLLPKNSHFRGFSVIPLGMICAIPSSGCINFSEQPSQKDNLFWWGVLLFGIRKLFL